MRYLRVVSSIFVLLAVVVAMGQEIEIRISVTLEAEVKISPAVPIPSKAIPVYHVRIEKLRVLSKRLRAPIPHVRFEFPFVHGRMRPLSISATRFPFQWPHVVAARVSKERWSKLGASGAGKGTTITTTMFSFLPEETDIWFVVPASKREVPEQLFRLPYLGKRFDISGLKIEMASFHVKAPEVGGLVLSEVPELSPEVRIALGHSSVMPRVTPVLLAKVTSGIPRGTVVPRSRTRVPVRYVPRVRETGSVPQLGIARARTTVGAPKSEIPVKRVSVSTVSEVESMAGTLNLRLNGVGFEVQGRHYAVELSRSRFRTFLDNLMGVEISWDLPGSRVGVSVLHIGDEVRFLPTFGIRSSLGPMRFDFAMGLGFQGYSESFGVSIGDLVFRRTRETLMLRLDGVSIFWRDGIAGVSFRYNLGDIRVEEMLERDHLGFALGLPVSNGEMYYTLSISRGLELVGWRWSMTSSWK